MLSLLCGVASLASSPQAFVEASGQYEAGKYQDAVKTLQAAPVSPGVLHNLGNAEFKSGRTGAAILAWERARVLDPSFRNSAANLHFARSQAGLDEPRWIWHERYAAWQSPDAWLWIASITFWAALAFFTLPALLEIRRTVWTQAGAATAIVIFILTIPALVGIVSRGNVGIVLAADTELKLTPTQEGEMLGKLSEGEMARVEKKRGEFLYIRASSDRAGWVRRNEFTRIWP